MPLFDSEDLSQYVQYPVDDDAAGAAERVVSGWLRSATGPLAWYAENVTSASLPPELYAWAIELGAMVHENPAGLSSETVADTTTTWNRGRRAEILAEAAAWAGTSLTKRSGPRGRFPQARPWPDPVERPCRPSATWYV